MKAGAIADDGDRKVYGQDDMGKEATAWTPIQKLAGSKLGRSYVFIVTLDQATSCRQIPSVLGVQRYQDWLLVVGVLVSWVWQLAIWVGKHVVAGSVQFD